MGPTWAGTAPGHVRAPAVSRCAPQGQVCDTHGGRGRQSHTPQLLPEMFKKAVHERGAAGLRTLGSR